MLCYIGKKGRNLCIIQKGVVERMLSGWIGIQETGCPGKGMVIYYSNQCPHTDKYAPVIKKIAEQHGTTVILHKIETMEQAQNAPSPFTTYSFFYNGDFITNEIMAEKRFERF